MVAVMSIVPAANGNVNISSNGTANVVVVTSTGVNVSGVISGGALIEKQSDSQCKLYNNYR
jgi:hypothetical protein